MGYTTGLTLLWMKRFMREASCRSPSIFMEYSSNDFRAMSVGSSIFLYGLPALKRSDPLHVRIAHFARGHDKQDVLLANHAALERLAFGTLCLTEKRRNRHPRQTD